MTTDPLTDAALEWQVVLWSGEVSSEERQTFERWLAADPAHRRAWERVQGVSRQIRAVPGAIAGEVLRAATQPPSRPRRRNLLRGLVLVGGSGLVVYAVRETPAWRSATAEHRTARGERRDLTLPDGSRLTLNTATALDLRFTASERRVLLRSGEVLIATVRDAAPSHRPFIVETSEGEIRALGTRFTVRRLEDVSPQRSAVQVVDGAVELVPRRGGSPLRLAAGQQARFTGDAAEPPGVADPTATAWSRGLLVAERLRLADFLAELGRYRSGVLRCDPAVADLVVSGVYPLQDTDAVLQSLAQVLPLRVQSATRYWVTVTAR